MGLGREVISWIIFNKNVLSASRLGTENHGNLSVLGDKRVKGKSWEVFLLGPAIFYTLAHIELYIIHWVKRILERTEACSSLGLIPSSCAAPSRSLYIPEFPSSSLVNR